MTLTTLEMNRVLLNPEVRDRTRYYVYGRLDPINLGRHLDDVIGRVLLGYTEYTMGKGLDPNLLTNLYPYLHTNLKWFLRDETRNENRTKRIERTDLRTSPTGDYTRRMTLDPLKYVMTQETLDRINDRLSDRELHVSYLMLEGYTYKEIGEMEGVTKQMVMKIVTRTRKKLNDLKPCT